MSSRESSPADQTPDRPEAPPSYDSSRGEYSGISSVGLESLEDVRAAKDFAEMIVDTIREGLLVLDLDLCVKSANESFYKQFDVSPEETLGKRVYDLGNGQWDIPELRELLEEILPENKFFNDFEVEHEFESIGRRQMLLNARQLDEHQLILLAIEDVTERRRSERKLRTTRAQYDLIVRNAHEYAVIAMDEGGRIISWSRGAERILGWPAEEVVGEPCALFFTPDDREAGVPEQEMRRAKTEGSAPDERWHLRRDGRRFWGSGFMVALREDERLHGFLKILRDDTERKEAQEALRALNQTLETRIQERTRQVRELASALTLAEQAERRRISQLLHDDLQQALYGIQLKLSIAQKDLDAGVPEAARSSLADADAWVRRSVDLTRNLTLDLSPPVLKSEGLTGTLAWLKSQMKELHELAVVIHAEQEFRTSEENLRVLIFQIVRELLFNVAKHAGVDRATVTLRDMDHHVQIVVEDEGRGFDVEAAEALAAEDPGFGLFSVRERLGLFGGSMEIASAPGEGTQVTVEVPLRLE